MKASRLLSLSLAALLCSVSATPPAFAQAAPQTAAKKPAQDPELQAAIAKSNAYTSLSNRTIRAIESWDRYKSWVDMKKGPTGKERYISSGLSSRDDVQDVIAKAEAAAGQPPAQPELDAAVKRYIAAYQELAPLITRAERYYERKDYRDDNAAEGRELHAKMVPAAEAFLRDRRSRRLRHRARRLFRRDQGNGPLQGQQSVWRADDRFLGQLLARQSARFPREARQVEGGCPQGCSQRCQPHRLQLQYDGVDVGQRRAHDPLSCKVRLLAFGASRSLHRDRGDGAAVLRQSFSSE